MTMKCIAIFAPMGTLDHQTGIMNAIRCFASAGYRVDVLTVRNRRFPEAKFDHTGVTLCYLPFTFDSDREPRALVTLLFTAWVLMRRGPTHRVVFAGGLRGLFAAYLYSLFRRCTYLNYQTELYIGETLDTRGKRLFKAIERRAAQRARVTIEHDEQRGELLTDDLGVPPGQIIIVPNAPCGPARARPSEFLHRRFGLDPMQRLLLSPGSLSESFETSKVVAAAQRLPPGWCCVVHSAQPRSPDEPYLRQLQALNSAGRVLFSLEPLPYAQIDDLLASASVGIALYSSEVGQNIASVGLSSGKLSHFLKLGIPVIVSPLPGLAAFVRQHRVGEVLDDPACLPQLIARIEADSNGYRMRALRCFDEHLSYDYAFRSVLAVTDALACDPA